MKPVSEILAFAKANWACDEAVDALERAQTEQEQIDVIMAWQGWLSRRGFDIGELPEWVTHCGGRLYLGGYAHPLPSGFTYCGGVLDLRGYAHPLPPNFTHCGGTIYLGGYAHPLPPNFKPNTDERPLHTDPAGR
jgi:hypothetical protein